MQGWTATMELRKRSTKRLKHTGNLFRNDLQLISVLLIVGLKPFRL